VQFVTRDPFCDLSLITNATEVKETMAPRRRGDKTAEPTEPVRKSTRSRRGGGGGEAKNEMPTKKSPAKKGTVAKAAPPQKGRGGRPAKQDTPTKGKAKGKQQVKKPVAKKPKKEEEKPKTSEELDREMDDYMMKNEKVAAKKLDESMDDYWEAKKAKEAEAGKEGEAKATEATA
jgi:hypothetical protein